LPIDIRLAQVSSWKWPKSNCDWEGGHEGGRVCLKDSSKHVRRELVP
jgi:hypothetical protein